MDLFNKNGKKKAAVYIRMSTEHQKYSPENQMAAIRVYADKNGYEIVKTYADEGKSGLNLDGRASLQQMLYDVDNGLANYEAILVLDVTRWGRFQDADESAYYEYKCKMAGIKVQYCAEQFENDGSPIATIIKGVKRTMAAEYSRELSCKVFAGQARLITKGYKQGGSAGYGLRRMLIDEHGNHKGILYRGEHKSIATDRVILVPGPDEEIKNVNWMYNMFVHEGRSEKTIAEILNNHQIKTDQNKDWTSATVKEVLTNEKYIGNSIFNRRSFKLKIKHVVNPEEQWVRCNGAFTPIVDKDLFYRAKSIFTSRSFRLSDDEMLQKLRDLKEEKGYLSALIINERPDMPSSAAYSGRFGGLMRAYQLVGYTPDRDLKFIEINRFLREFHSDVLEDTIQKIMNVGADVHLTKNNSLLRINNMFTVSIVISRCNKLKNGNYMWKVRFDTSLNPDITVAVRMDSVNKTAYDYYLLPSLDFKTNDLKLKENNQDLIDSYRYDNLNYLLELSKVIQLREVA